MTFREIFIVLNIFTINFFCSPLIGFDQYPTVQEAAFYDHHSHQQRYVALDTLKDLVLCGDEQILDIGCGSGKITANLAGRVPDGVVFGLDLSEGMITFAQNNYGVLYDNLFFIRNDILKLSSIEKYDLICSFNSLHWIVEHELLLKLSYNALSPSGHILFTIPCSPFSEVAIVFQKVSSQEPWQSYLKKYNHPRRKFSIEEYVNLLTLAGFQEIEVKQVPFTYYFETKRDFINWFKTFSPMLFCIPVQEQTTFLANLIDCYLQMFPMQADGRIQFKQNELIIKARK